MDSSLDEFLEFNEQAEGMETLMESLRRVKDTLPPIDDYPAYVTDDEKEEIGRELEVLTIVIMQQICLMKSLSDLEAEAEFFARLLHDGEEGNIPSEMPDLLGEAKMDEILDDIRKRLAAMNPKRETLAMIIEEATDFMIGHADNLVEKIENIIS